MKTVIEKTKVYKYDELSKKAKEVALNDFIQSMAECGLGYEEDSEFLECVAESERLQTPWFLGGIIYEKMKDRIEEDMRVNEYEYIKNGKMFILRKEGN